MAVSTEVSRNNYLGTGNLSTYSYTFQILENTHIRVATRDSDGVVHALTLGAEFTVTGTGNASGGTITLVAGNLPIGIELVIMHDPTFLQEFRFNNLGTSYYPERHESAYDRNVRYSQVLKEKIDRAIKFSPFDAPFDATLPKLIPDSIVRVNSAGNKLILAGPGEFIGPAGPQGNPLFIGTGDPNLIPSFDPTPNPGDVFVDENGDVWKFNGTTWSLTGDSLPVGDTATAVGYSARYNDTVNILTLQGIVNYIFQFQYTPPTISLSGSSNILREKGASVSGITLTANVTKRSDPIAEVKFYRNPSTLLDTQTSGGAIPNGGSSTYAYATAFTDNVTFRAEAIDNGATGGPTTVSATTTYSFVYPYYYGAGANGLTPSQVALLTKDVIASNANLTRTLSVGSGQYTYFAYPASYGALTSILDVNGFEVLPAWTASTGNITGLDGNAVSYRIYKGNNALAAGSYQFTWKR